MQRIQFLVTDEMAEKLDGLVQEMDLKTRTQLLNTAITLLDWAVRERKAGNIIASVDEKKGKIKEIDMPGLPVTLSRAVEMAIQEPSALSQIQGIMAALDRGEEMLKNDNLSHSERLQLVKEYEEARRHAYDYMHAQKKAAGEMIAVGNFSLDSQDSEGEITTVNSGSTSGSPTTIAKENPPKKNR